jgi:hypothetical protein
MTKNLVSLTDVWRGSKFPQDLGQTRSPKQIKSNHTKGFDYSKRNIIVSIFVFAEEAILEQIQIENIKSYPEKQLSVEKGLIVSSFIVRPL